MRSTWEARPGWMSWRSWERSGAPACGGFIGRGRPHPAQLAAPPQARSCPTPRPVSIDRRGRGACAGDSQAFGRSAMWNRATKHERFTGTGGGRGMDRAGPRRGASSSRAEVPGKRWVPRPFSRREARHVGFTVMLRAYAAWATPSCPVVRRPWRFRRRHAEAPEAVDVLYKRQSNRVPTLLCGQKNSSLPWPRHRRFPPAGFLASDRPSGAKRPAALSGRLARRFDVGRGLIVGSPAFRCDERRGHLGRRAMVARFAGDVRTAWGGGAA